MRCGHYTVNWQLVFCIHSKVGSLDTECTYFIAVHNYHGMSHVDNLRQSCLWKVEDPEWTTNERAPWPPSGDISRSGGLLTPTVPRDTRKGQWGVFKGQLVLWRARRSEAYWRTGITSLQSRCYKSPDINVNGQNPTMEREAFSRGENTKSVIVCYCQFYEFYKEKVSDKIVCHKIGKIIFRWIQ